MTSRRESDLLLYKDSRQIRKDITFEDVLKYIAVVESRNAYFTNTEDSDSAVGALVPEL